MQIVQLNTVTFGLVLPRNLDDCSEHCREAYEWAVSVFFSGLPWHRVPGGPQSQQRQRPHRSTRRAVLDRFCRVTSASPAHYSPELAEEERTAREDGENGGPS